MSIKMAKKVLEWSNVFYTGRVCDSLVVAAIRKGISLGHSLPDVLVKSFRDSYVILNGNHRMLAYRAEGIVCEGAIAGEPSSNVYPERFIPFEEVIVRRMDNIPSCHRLIDSLSYLPRDIAREFCQENDLDVNEYLSQ